MQNILVFYWRGPHKIIAMLPAVLCLVQIKLFRLKICSLFHELRMLLFFNASVHKEWEPMLNMESTVVFVATEALCCRSGRIVGWMPGVDMSHSVRPHIRYCCGPVRFDATVPCSWVCPHPQRDVLLCKPPSLSLSLSLMLALSLILTLRFLLDAFPEVSSALCGNW